MSYKYRDEPEALPPYMQLKLAHAREDIAAKVNSPYLEKLFAFELSTLNRMLEEAEREQSMQLAREALSYKQDVLYEVDNTHPQPLGRNSRIR